MGSLHILILSADAGDEARGDGGNVTVRALNFARKARTFYCFSKHCAGQS